MRDLYSPPLRTCGLILALLLLSHIRLAHAENLYRVELIVFAYPAGGAAEQWEALPELAYPESPRVLIDPAGQRGAASLSGDLTQPPAPVGSSAALGPGSPSHYVLLPATERELGAATASMQGSGRYRVLFHQAWVQPMPAQSVAAPILLDRSAESGAWPELQGTIVLYKAGDYVLETNLWLNTQGDYLPGAWRMPPPPRGPGGAGLSEELPATGITDYPYRHAVLLQQTRHMRVGKVYYIDHPLLGVAAKITPLEAPGPEPAVVNADIPQTASPTP